MPALSKFIFILHDRMAQVAKKPFEVIDKFVDAPRIIIDSDVRVAAGKAFDEIDERFFRLPDIVDCRRAIGSGEVVFKKVEKIAAFGDQEIRLGAETAARRGFCGGGEIFENRMCAVGFAVKNAAYALCSWRKGAGFIAFECREQKSIELFVALDNGADRRGKSIVFHDPKKILSS